MRTSRPRITYAATVAAGALAAGALVGLTSTTADAVTGTSTYACTFPVLGTLDVPVAATVPDLSSLPAGTDVPAGSLDLGLAFTLTDAIAGLLPNLTGLGISDMSLEGVPGGIPIQGTSFGSYSALDHSLPATGSNGPFTLPDPGSYPLTMPESFDLVGTSLLGGPVSIPCTTGSPADLGTLTTTGATAPGDSLTTATLAKKRIHKGQRARVISDVVAVTPLPLPIPATGDLEVKRGTKVIGQGSLDPATGSATIRTLRFKKPGKYRLKVRYLGSTLLNPSLDKVVVRVLKRRS
jgi:hypothetical protein